MTARHAGYVVTLSRDMREDDAEATIAALRQIKGVVDVTPIEVDAQTHAARARVRTDLERKLWDALHGDAKK